MNKSQNQLNRLELIAAHFISELKAIFSDKGALLILIGAMLVYPVIYSIAYMNETCTNLRIGVVDLDGTDASRKYVQMIDATPELGVTCQPGSLSEAEKLFMENKISGLVLIDNGFQGDVLSGEQAHVAVYADASYFLKYRNEYMAVAMVNAYFSGGISVKHYMAEGQSFEQAKVSSDPLPTQYHILYNPSTGYGSFIMPGIILVIIQQTLLIGIGVLGGSFSESKKSPFLLPLTKRKKEVLPFLAGKAGAYLLITLFNVAFALFAVHHWFQYPDKTSFLEIGVLVFPYLIAVIFLGIGLSTLFRHRESAIVFMVFLSPIALFFTGLSWPVSAMPEWIVIFSKLMPSTTVIPAYLRLRTMGVGIAGVKHELIWLYVQATVYVLLTIVYYMFRVNRDKRKKEIPIELKSNLPG
ncbi:MAG: ABC transporter permease [Prolixibacteraceae bacterium]